MSKEQVIEKLIDQINGDMQIFLGILALLVAIFAFFQWRYSNGQIEKLRSGIEQDLIDKHKISQISSMVEKENSLEEKVYSLNEKMGELKELEKEHQKLLDKVESLESTRVLEATQVFNAQLPKLHDPDMTVAAMAKTTIDIKVHEILGNNFINQMMKSVLIHSLYNQLKRGKQNRYTRELIKMIEHRASDLLKQGDDIFKRS